MPAVALSPQAQQALATNRAIKRTLGRFSGPEFFVQQAATVNTAPVLVRPVPVGEAVVGLKGVLRMRVVIATGNMTTVAAEAMQQYVNRLFINGASAKFGQQTLWDMSGGTLFAWSRCFANRDSSLNIGSTAATYTRANAGPGGTGILGTPNTTPATTFGNTGTYDIEIHYDIPFVPTIGSSQRLNQIAYALRPEDWPNGLNVQFFFGDQNSFGTIGTATFTFTAFGSASGTPVMNVYTNTVLLNDLRGVHPSAVMIRQEAPAVQAVTAVGNNILFSTPTRQRVLNLVIKAGTNLAGSPASSFGTTSDFIVGNILLKFNGTTPRNFQDWWAMREYYGFAFESLPPAGYGIISFVESSNLDAVLDATKLPPGADFSLLASILTTGATQQVFIIQEYAIGDPQTRLPGQNAN